MKLIYLIAGTCHSGGMERVLANKANYLVAHGYDVTIITTDQRGLPPFFHLDERIACYDLGINYEENNGKSFLNKLIHYPFKQWKHKKRLTNLLNQLKADIVISMFCNDAAFITKIKDGSHKLLEIHFSRFKRLQYGRQGFWKWADCYRSKQDAKTVRQFERFIVLTEEDKTYWGDTGNICVIPNSLSFKISYPAALINKKVIAIGRYSYQKGFDRLIAAWGKICGCAEGWSLHIIGSGELQETLQNQINTLNIADTVVLEHPTTHIQTFYQEASILALSSHYEGLPMVLLEAQAAGLPIVSFACKCGPRDVVTEGQDGFLVEEGDIDGLATSLLRLMQDKNLRKRMGEAAFEHSKRYEEAAIMKQWTDLFADIVRTKP